MPSLLTLPPEIRLQIYKYAFRPSLPTQTWLATPNRSLADYIHSRNPPHPPPPRETHNDLLALLLHRLPGSPLRQTCRFIHWESSEEYERAQSSDPGWRFRLFGLMLEELGFLVSPPTSIRGMVAQEAVMALHMVISKEAGGYQKASRENIDFVILEHWAQTWGAWHSCPCGKGMEWGCGVRVRETCFRCGGMVAVAWLAEMPWGLKVPELVRVVDGKEGLTALGEEVEAHTEMSLFCRNEGIPPRFNAFASVRESSERLIESWWRFELERQRAGIRFRRLRDKVREAVEAVEESAELSRIASGDLQRWIAEFEVLEKWNEHLRKNDRDVFPEVEELHRLFLVVIHVVDTAKVMREDRCIGKWERGVAARDYDSRSKRAMDWEFEPQPGVCHLVRPSNRI